MAHETQYVTGETEWKGSGRFHFSDLLLVRTCSMYRPNDHNNVDSFANISPVRLRLIIFLSLLQLQANAP
jgi:hypothetical protein